MARKQTRAAWVCVHTPVCRTPRWGPWCWVWRPSGLSPGALPSAFGWKRDASPVCLRCRQLVVSPPVETLVTYLASAVAGAVVEVLGLTLGRLF